MIQTADHLLWLFSHNLIRLRKQKGLTQDQTAIALDIPNRTYARYEQAWRLPKAQKLARFCNFFECEVSEFFKEIKEVKTMTELELFDILNPKRDLPQATCDVIHLVYETMTKYQSKEEKKEQKEQK